MCMVCALVCVWCVHGVFVVCTWCVHGVYMVCRCAYSAYMLCAWCVGVISCVYGVYMVCACGCMWHRTHVQIRGQLRGAGSLLPALCGLCRSSTSPQACVAGGALIYVPSC